MEIHVNFLAVLVAAVVNYVGFFNWLGLIAPVTLTTKLYEKKPWGLWLLDNGFWLISLLTMGIILSVWM